MAGTIIETSSATLKLDKDGIIFLRIKKGVRVNNENYVENIAARKELAAGERAGVVCVFPEDMDFANEVLQMDQYANVRVADFTSAMAIVTSDLLYDRLFTLHAKRYIHGVPHRVFHNETEAVSWVKEQRRVSEATS